MKGVSYLHLSEKEFKEKIDFLYELFRRCSLCPRNCKVNREKGERGFCQAGKKLKISTYFPHFGEEKVLVGRGGSGTIFFSYCNLKCLYCQNYEISHLGEGKEVSVEDCAKMMLKLQKLKCHNINLVTPTHFVFQILSAIKIAKERGLKIPIVYNCGGYERVEVLKALDKVIDIYMPDFKYGDEKSAEKYSSAPDYFKVAKKAIKEMQNQVGDLIVFDGLAKRGLLIRHLVLPNNLANSEKILTFIARKISKNAFVNIMAQYWPAGEAFSFPELSRRITYAEYQKVLEFGKKLSLKRAKRW